MKKSKKDLFLCVLSAVLLVLSFPNFDVEIFAWIGFVPLFFALKDKSPLRSFFLAWFTGVLFWFGTIYWLIHVTLAGLIILVLYLSLYFGFFGLFFSFFTRYGVPDTRYDFRFIPFIIPSLWTILEYLRGWLFTGFPWIPLGYSQYVNLPVIQIADIAGVWGVSFLVMMVNVAIFSVIGYSVPLAVRMKKTLIPLFCFIIVLTYGSWKLSSSKSTSYEPRPPERHAEGRYAYGVGAPAAQATSSNIRITVIQGNIPQEMKWDQMASDRIVGKYLNLTSLALAQSPDLVIWPEAAFPLILKQENGYAPFADLVKKFNKPLLAGTVTSEGLQYHNSVLLVSEKGRVADSYRKIHLVPFGEYIPLRGIFGFLETVVPIGDFFPGTEYTVFAIPRSSGNAIRCGTLICFEDVFPGLSRQFVLRGAGILINMTNDAWFRKTSAPYQHLSASVFRAVENRVPVVRAANTGVSGFIAPSGKIISLVQDARRERTFIDGILTESVAVEEGPLSFYTRYGDVFIGACASFIIISLFASYIKYQKSKIKYKP